MSEWNGRTLTQNDVTSVIQTHDGFLWMGTYSGLARFDGVRFTVFNEKNTSGLRNSRVTSLFESGDGTLWIGHENGAVTTCKEGIFQPVKIRAAWNSRKIIGIAADEAGDVWLLNDSGLLARVSQRGGAVAANRYCEMAKPRPGHQWNHLGGAGWLPVGFGTGATSRCPASRAERGGLRSRHLRQQRRRALGGQQRTHPQMEG